MFKCIYCKRSAPDAEPSTSHVIPDALGLGPTLTNAVCDKCNHRINLEIENPVIQSLAILRNILGIDGRRGRPRFAAKARFSDATMDINIRTPQELDSALFFFKLAADPNGKTKIAIIGDQRKVLQAVILPEILAFF